MDADFIKRSHANWCQYFIEQEVQNEFPVLRLLQNAGAECLLHYLDIKAKEEQVEVLKLVSRRMTMNRPPDVLHEDHRTTQIVEECWGQAYLLTEKYLPGREQKKIKSELRTSLLPILESVLHAKVQSWGGGEYRFVSPSANGLYLITDIDLGSSSHDIVYSHRLGTQDMPPFIIESTSISEWIGLSYEAAWDHVRLAEVPECRRRICEAISLGYLWFKELAQSRQITAL